MVEMPQCGLGFRVAAIPNPMNRLAWMQQNGLADCHINRCQKVGNDLYCNLPQNQIVLKFEISLLSEGVGL